MSRHYLTNVQYNAEKQEVLVELSSEGGKTVKRIGFFPFTNFSTKLPRDKLEELLLSFSLKKFYVEGKGEKKKIIASSFEELKKISNVLAKSFGKKPLVIEPERQFLLGRNLAYFDAVNPETMEKTGEKQEIGFFLTKEVPFEHAIKIAEEETLSLVKKAALSRILKTKMALLPKKKENITETLLENIYFKSGYPVAFKERNDFYSAKEFAPLGYYENISKIDFSPVWIQLFTKPFFNIGLETKNCSCCSPVTLDDNNLYPDSMIEIIFEEEGVFYESSSSTFAKKFHDTMPMKGMREKKKKEFFLRSFPLGPFSKGQKAKVPISDAKHLIGKQKARLGKGHYLSWFCREKESLFSKEISKINSSVKGLEKDSAVNSPSLYCEKNFIQHFSSFQLELYGKILSEIPFQLLNLNSKFFSQELASSIKSIQEATIHKFREFSEEKGYRVLHADGHSAFIRGSSSLSLVKSFSKELSLPKPTVKAFSKSSKLQ